MSMDTYYILTTVADGAATAQAKLEDMTVVSVTVPDGNEVAAAKALAEQQGWVVRDNDYDPEHIFRAQPVVDRSAGQ